MKQHIQTLLKLTLVLPLVAFALTATGCKESEVEDAAEEVNDAAEEVTK